MPIFIRKSLAALLSEITKMRNLHCVCKFDCGSYVARSFYENLFPQLWSCVARHLQIKMFVVLRFGKQKN